MKKIIPIMAAVLALFFIIFIFYALKTVKPKHQGMAKTKNSQPKPVYSFNEAIILTKADSLAKAGSTAEAIKLYQKIAIDSPESTQAAVSFYKLGELYLKSNLLLAARDSYKKCVFNFPNSPFIKEARSKLGMLNVALLFSGTRTPESATYNVEPGDTLVRIAKKFNTTPELLSRCNNLTKGAIFAGDRLKVPKIKFSLLVSKSQNTMILKADEEVFKIYNVATGKDNCSPVGAFKIVNKLTNPVWFHEGKSYPPEAKENILGTRWLGFDKAGYGIHGTTEPGSIGKQVTNGCVRMINNQAEELYDMIPIGTQVMIVE